MDKIIRSEPPAWLIENGDKWTKEWESAGKSARFTWHGKKNWVDLSVRLSQMTQHHCSFCDVFEVGPDVASTIEHFRPKSLFPLLAYQWENLFICCHNCQSKGNKFDDALLKPDIKDYEFDYYFDIDWISGKLIPNIDISDEEQHRALVTIKLYKLNDNQKPKARRRALAHFQDMRTPQLDEFSYRFFIKRSESFERVRAAYV
jgi:uncharacterized protein (TIGR02646 family)